jgi:type I restriction enzyme S subunit
MKTIAFEEFVEINPTVRLAREHEYPFVPMDRITPGRRYVTTDIVRSSGGGAKFRGGDTLFARITPCLENGKIAQYKARPDQVAFGSTEYWVFRARAGISDPAFVFYLANTDLIRKPAEKSMSGASGRQRADIDAITKIQVPHIDLDHQCRIASILSAYDDMIENNTRRIGILEEMTQRLYEEWFVHFRFPGHEQPRFKETELGRIPKGWNIEAIKHAYEDLFDGPHATPKTSDTGPIFLGIKNIKEAGGLDLAAIRHISNEDFPAWTKRVLPKEGDIVFTYEATLNRYALIPKGFNGCLGRRLALIRPRNEYRHFLYLHLFSDDWRNVIRKNTLSGVTVDRIPLTTLPEFPVLLPPVDIAATFEKLASPFFGLIQNLSDKCTNLRAQRDLLLPKLVSGELDVSDLPFPDIKDEQAA